MLDCLSILLINVFNLRYYHRKYDFPQYNNCHYHYLLLAVVLFILFLCKKREKTKMQNWDWRFFLLAVCPCIFFCVVSVCLDLNAIRYNSSIFTSLLHASKSTFSYAVNITFVFSPANARHSYITLSSSSIFPELAICVSALILYLAGKTDKKNLAAMVMAIVVLGEIVFTAKGLPLQHWLLFHLHTFPAEKYIPYNLS